MFNFIRKISRKKIDKHFNGRLISTLHKDHEALTKLFNLLEKAVKDSSNDTLKKLSDFLDELNLHLLLENSKLYTYLEFRYKYCDLKKLKKIKEEISKNLYLFDKLKTAIKENRHNEALLLIEKIKHFLLRRIQYEEEKLYDVYTNLYKCSQLRGIL